jgi:hypothetical protein
MVEEQEDVCVNEQVYLGLVNCHNVKIADVRISIKDYPRQKNSERVSHDFARVVGKPSVQSVPAEVARARKWCRSSFLEFTVPPLREQVRALV